MNLNVVLSSFSAWHHLGFCVTCYFCSPCVAYSPGACPCGISLSFCRYPEHIFSVTGMVPEAVLSSSTQWLEPPGHPGHTAAANQGALQDFLSFSVCREMIHENRAEKNQSLAKIWAWLQAPFRGGWAVKCPAHVSTVRMGLGTFGGTAWIISFLKVEFLYQGFEWVL